jgi:hypothetical protein
MDVPMWKHGGACQAARSITVHCLGIGARRVCTVCIIATRRLPSVHGRKIRERLQRGRVQVRHDGCIIADRLRLSSRAQGRGGLGARGDLCWRRRTGQTVASRQQTAEQTLDTGHRTGHQTPDTGHGVGSVVARQARDATRTRTRTRTADGRARARASRQQREGADKMLVAGGLHCLRGVTGKPEIRMQQPEIRGGRLRYGTGIQGHAPCLQAAAYSSACYALWPNKLRPCNQSTTSTSRAAGQCPQNAELHGGGSSRLLT